MIRTKPFVPLAWPKRTRPIDNARSPSSDGKWLAFISFEPDVKPNDHSGNKPVMLRLMPVAGGKIIVAAKIFGGQGTMNVPSWSPDSRSFAFVSYTPVTAP